MQPRNPARDRSLLVAQGPLQRPQLDEGGVGEDLDRPPAVAAAGVAGNRLVRHLEALHQLHRAHPPAQQGEVAGVGPGAEPTVAALQLGLARPAAGRVADHQWSVQSQHGAAGIVPGDERGDLGITGGQRLGHHPALLVEHGQPRGVPSAPGQVHADEPHAASISP
jgi:hypothetical protein